MAVILNGKEYIRKLINISYSCIGVPLLFFIWVYLESNAETLVPKVSENHILMLFFPVLATSLILIVYGHKQYKSHTLAARELPELTSKLNRYQIGCTYQFVSYLLSSLLISLGFFLTDFQPFAALFGIMIVLFSINNPNARKVAHELRLKDNDKEIILQGLDLPAS